MQNVLEVTLGLIADVRKTMTRKLLSTHIVDAVYSLGVDRRRGVRDMLVQPKTTDDMWNNEQNLFRALERPESNLANQAIVVNLLPAAIYAFPDLAERHLNDFLSPLGFVCHRINPKAQALRDLRVLVGEACREHGEAAQVALELACEGTEEAQISALKEIHESIAAMQQVLQAVEAITPEK